MGKPLHHGGRNMRRKSVPSTQYRVPSNRTAGNDKHYPLTTTEVNMSGKYYVSRDFARYSVLGTQNSQGVTPHVTSGAPNPTLLSQSEQVFGRNDCALRLFALSREFPVFCSAP